MDGLLETKRLAPFAFALATTVMSCISVHCLAAEPVVADGYKLSEISPGVSLFGDPKVPDISGLWLGTVIGVPGKASMTNSGGSQDGRPPTYLSPWPLPYTPAFQKLADERAEGSRRAGQSTMLVPVAAHSACR